MDMHAMRNAVDANATARTFFNAPAEELINRFRVRHDGSEWIHPVSGDELAKLKAGVSRSQQPKEVDPLA